MFTILEIVSVENQLNSFYTRCSFIRAVGLRRPIKIACNFDIRHVSFLILEEKTKNKSLLMHLDFMTTLFPEPQSPHNIVITLNIRKIHHTLDRNSRSTVVLSVGIAAICIKSHQMAPYSWTRGTCRYLNSNNFDSYLFQHPMHRFDGGHQGVWSFVNVVMVGGVLLLHGLQSLLSLAQGAFHLLQLPAQGFVGLLQLRFHLCIFIW